MKIILVSLLTLLFAQLALSSFSGSTQGLVKLRNQIYDSLLDKYRRSLSLPYAQTIRWGDIIAINWPDGVFSRKKADWGMIDIEKLLSVIDKLEITNAYYERLPEGCELSAKNIYIMLLDTFQRETLLNVPAILWNDCRVSSLPPLSSFDYRQWTQKECEYLQSNMSSIHFSLLQPDSNSNPNDLAQCLSNTEVYKLLVDKFNQDTHSDLEMIPWNSVSIANRPQISSLTYSRWTLSDRQAVLNSLDKVFFTLTDVKKQKLSHESSTPLAATFLPTDTESLHPQTWPQQQTSVKVPVTQQKPEGTVSTAFCSSPSSSDHLNLDTIEPSSSGALDNLSVIPARSFNILSYLSVNVDSEEFRKCKSFVTRRRTPENVREIRISRSKYELLERAYASQLNLKYSLGYLNWNQPGFANLFKEVCVIVKLKSSLISKEDGQSILPDGLNLKNPHITLEELYTIKQFLPSIIVIDGK